MVPVHSELVEKSSDTVSNHRNESYNPAFSYVVSVLVGYLIALRAISVLNLFSA